MTEIIDLGQLCYSRRSCHDTHFALYGNWVAHGEWRRDVWIHASGDGGYVLRQYSFSGNVKVNVIHVRCGGETIECSCREWSNKEECLDCARRIIELPCEWAKDALRDWVKGMPSHAREYVKLFIQL